MKERICGEKFNFSGRIDLTVPETPMLIWPGNYIAFSVVGKGVSLVLENYQNWDGNKIGLVVDGVDRTVDIKPGMNTVVISEGLENIRHDYVIYRPKSGGYIRLLWLLGDDDARLCEPLKKPSKRIEFYGDSVTAGDVVDCDEYEGMPDPPENRGQWDNSWHTYAMRTARMLPAEVYNTSQGGIAIFDKTGYFEMPNMRGVESCYNKLKYCTPWEITEWDFDRFVPHVIVFAVGQNDHNPWRECIYDADYREKWENKYIEIINDIRSHAPKATVILALTLLNHEPEWDMAMEEIKDKMGGADNKVYHFMYKRCGKATPGHPRNNEQIEMAEELTEFLRSLPEFTWDD